MSDPACTRLAGATAPAAIVVVLAALLLGSCASLPTEYDRPDSRAVSDTDDTRLGRGITPMEKERSVESGIFPFGNGLDAFVARLAMAEADLGETTLSSRESPLRMRSLCQTASLFGQEAPCGVRPAGGLICSASHIQAGSKKGVRSTPTASDDSTVVDIHRYR